MQIFHKHLVLLHNYKRNSQVELKPKNKPHLIFTQDLSHQQLEQVHYTEQQQDLLLINKLTQHQMASHQKAPDHQLQLKSWPVSNKRCLSSWEVQMLLLQWTKTVFILLNLHRQCNLSLQGTFNKLSNNLVDYKVLNQS